MGAPIWITGNYDVENNIAYWSTGNAAPWPGVLRPGDVASGILGAVVSQQLSTHAADAIARKLQAAALTDPSAIAAASDEALRACGLSAPKIRYLRGISAAGLDFDALAALPDDEVIAILTALPGIGRWTAEIYLMFALGRADAFAAGDLALQEAARMMFDLPARPTPAALIEMAEPWRPWRSVAARALWAWM